MDTLTAQNSTVTVTGSRSPSPTPSPPPVIISPCAACKILRRRCADKCVLAPYFPPSEPSKFTIAHRVFGASNIIKFLQELPESQRADAVSSMVYEAGARIRDPVYGSAGAICQLQKQVSELQAQLAKAQAELVNMQVQQANLAALLCEMTYNKSQQNQPNSPQSVDNFITSPQSSSQDDIPNCYFDDDHNNTTLWDPIWT